MIYLIKVCVPNKKEELKLSVFSMITGMYESKTYSCKNGKYVASIMDDSAITCDEIIESYDEETKTIPKYFNEKKATCKMQNFYISLVFLSISIAL